MYILKTDVFLARFVRANRGDFANQAGVVAGLRRSSRVGKVYVSSFYPEHFKGLDDVCPIPPASVRGYLTNRFEGKILKKRPPVYWGGGVDLQDSGSKIKIALLFLRILLLKRSGSRFVIAFQGAGPIRTRFGKFCLKLISRLIDYAIVREPTAQKILIEDAAMSQAEVVLGVDSALLLEPPQSEFGRTYLQKHKFDLSRPILGVNLRRWYHQRGGWLPTEFRSKQAPVGAERMHTLISEMAQAISTNGAYSKILMIPMYRRYPEMWEDDIVLLEELKARLPSNYVVGFLEEDVSAFELLSIFSMLDVMIGVRLHSTIMAHIAGVPAIHIAYEHKGIEHYEHMRMRDLVISIDEASILGGAKVIQERLGTIQAHRDIIAEKCSRRCEELRGLAQNQLEKSLESITSSMS